MPPKVFISYRRDDSRYQARMIYHKFERALGREGVFMDVDSIPPGANFRKILKDWVDQCEVLLALIGPGWIDAIDQATGQRRLDSPSDFVRIEIAAALARSIPVVPILLDGTPMPAASRLPADLAELAHRQAELAEFRTFDADVERLIRRLGFNPASAERPFASERTRWEAELYDHRLDRREFWRLLEIAYKNWSMKPHPNRPLRDVVNSAPIPRALPLADNSKFPEWAWMAEIHVVGDAGGLLQFVSAIYTAATPPMTLKPQLLGGSNEFDRFDAVRMELAKFWDAWGRQEPLEQIISEQRADGFLRAHDSEVKLLMFLEIARVRWANSDLPGKWGLFRLAKRNAEVKT
ncbi:MAG TPA: toll/interleukin-1 receptor domain-containing protein [Hyphomicrobiaceae bacterium]|nr:toll/interleukin-1 receptor domain-containing protein [Hyphomicrobiaceae bacterium]